MQALLDVILPVFLVIGFGYLAVWKGWFSDAGVDGLMRFTQNYAIPCLLFRAISTLDLSAKFSPELLIAFYIGAGWDLSFVLAIGVVIYIYKFAVAILLIPALYGIHWVIGQYLGKDLSVRMREQAVSGN